MSEMSAVEKLQVHIEKLIDAGVPTVELSTTFLNEVLKEVATIKSTDPKEDSEVVFSGGNFTSE